MQVTVRRVLRWIAIAAAVAALAIQAFRPDRTNPPFDPVKTLQARTHLTPRIAAVLDRACADCHSHQTRWPWYSQVAPTSWFVTGHVKEARQHLNFSDWPDKIKIQDANLVMICEQVKRGSMPLPSYLLIHRASKLTADEKLAICEWTDAERERLRARQAQEGNAEAGRPAPPSKTGALQSE